MADEAPRSSKPRDSWLELISQWERGFDAFANQLMGSEGFSRLMNQSQQATLTLQKLIADTVGRQLRGLNVPTRDDYNTLTEALLRIERRLENIDRQLAAQSEGAPDSTSVPQPARTRQPPAEFLESEASAPQSSADGADQVAA